MPQSDGRNRLKRFQFELGDQTYTFQLNPEEYSQDEPSRSTVTQTKGGAWIDDFGGGLEIIFMRGSTGLRNGYSRFVRLRNMIRAYRDGTDPGNTPDEELIFHNFTDGESWVVHLDPSGFKLYRSKSNPLLYMYELRLTCLRKASDPKQEQRTEVIIDRDEFEERYGLEELEALTSGAPPRVRHPRGTFTEAERHRPGSPTAGPQFTPAEPGLPYIQNTDVPPVIPGHIASSVMTARANQRRPDTSPNIAPQGYLQTFAEGGIYEDIYADIRPVLDNRLSPLGMLYQRHIERKTYRTTTRRFDPGTLGDIVYNKLYPLDIWSDFGDTFSLLMLDLYAMTDAYHTDYRLYRRRVGAEDVDRLIGNIRWLVESLNGLDMATNHTSVPVVIEAVQVLRKVELLLSRMRRDPNLFEVDIAQQLDQLNAFRGGNADG